MMPVLKKIPISKIRPATYNPRVDLQKGDPEYEKIKRSILEFGLVEPLVWNEHNGVLVGGHQRLKVIKDLGDKEVVVSVVRIKDVRREKALNVALTKISGEWDDAKLAAVLLDLRKADFDVAITGFDQGDIDKLIEDLETPGAFAGVPPTIDVEHTCPKCGFRF